MRPTLEDLLPEREINRGLLRLTGSTFGGLFLTLVLVPFLASSHAHSWTTPLVFVPVLAGAIYAFGIQNPRDIRHSAALRERIAEDIRTHYGLTVSAHQLPLVDGEVTTLSLPAGRTLTAVFPTRNSPIALSALSAELPAAA